MPWLPEPQVIIKSLYKMIDLSPDEKIVTVIRKHWYVFVSQAVILIIGVVLPFLVYKFIPLFGIDLSGPNFLLFIFFASLWLLGCWVVFFIAWTNNYLDMLILTNKRVVDVEQVSLFYRTVSSFGHEKIQDITIEIDGLLATTMNFGNIHIQTAGEARELRLNSVGNPEAVRKIISDTISQNKIAPVVQTL